MCRRCSESPACCSKRSSGVGRRTYTEGRDPSSVEEYHLTGTARRSWQHAPRGVAMAAVTSSQGRKNSVAGHARWVRLSHWILAASVLTLAFSGFEILMVHPRLYWGMAGNDLTPALLELPVSRNYKHNGYDERVPLTDNASGPVSANRTYDIFHQNSWGRSLHFLAAWFLVVT